MSKADLAGGQTGVNVDSDAPRGRVWPILLLAIFLAAASVGLALAARDQAEPIALGILALLAVFGLLALFGGAAGILHLGVRPRQHRLIKAMADSAPAGVLISDEKGRVIYANAAYGRITGTENPSHIKPVERSFAGHPEIADAIYRIARAARDGIAWQEDVRLLHPGGADVEPSWLRIAVRKMQYGGKGKSWRVWHLKDITAESEHQEAAFLELQTIIDYLDHAPAGFFSAEEDGSLRYINATLAGWLGIDLAQTTGGSLGLKDIVADDGVHLLSGIKQKSVGSASQCLDIDLVSSDGEYMPVRVLHRVDFDEDGDPLPTRSLVLDRRPGAGAQGTMDAAEARFTRFFNSAPIGIATIDGAGRILMANGAFARIFKGQALSNRPLTDLVVKDCREILTKTLNNARTGASGLAPADVTAGGDSGGTAQLIISRPDETGAEGGGLIVFAIDTTEQKLLEMQVNQSQKMQAIGQLAGGMAHDFNNVLTSIIGFSDLLLTNHKPTDMSYKDIINIKQNANRAAALVRQLLAFSRRQTMRPEVLLLTDVISDLTMMLDRLLGEKVELKLKHDRDLSMVKIDLHQFEQVVVNLAVNARDAMMPEGGVLTISTSNIPEEQSKELDLKPMPSGEYVCCEVTDTGTGMAPEIMKKVFEPFFTTKDVNEGTGLGLSQVYGIVKQMDGFVFIESEVGKGTSFRIYLPPHLPEAEEEEAPKAPVEEKVERKDLTGQGTILLVEDEDSVRAFAARTLSSAGYTVLEAANGQSALELVGDGDDGIDLVISDVMMPEMDGPSLLKELRKRLKDFKVIFISGYAEDSFEKNLDEKEEFTFLPKPFSLKKLAETVKDVLEG